MPGLRPSPTIIGIPVGQGQAIGSTINEITGLLVEDGLAEDDISIVPELPDAFHISLDETSSAPPRGALEAAKEFVVARYILEPNAYKIPASLTKGLLVTFGEAGPSDGIPVGVAAAVIKGALLMLAPAQGGVAEVIDLASRVTSHGRGRQKSVADEIHDMEEELGVTDMLSNAQEAIGHVMSGRWRMSDVRELYDRLNRSERGRRHLRRWLTGAALPSPAGILVFLRGMRGYTYDDLDEIGAVVKLAEDGVDPPDQALETIKIVAGRFAADGMDDRKTETLQLSPENLSHRHAIPNIERPILNLPVVLRSIINGLRQRNSGDPNLVIGLTKDFANITAGLPRSVVASLWEVIMETGYRGWIAVIHRGRLLLDALFDPAARQDSQHVAVRIAKVRKTLNRTVEGREFLKMVEDLFRAGRGGEGSGEERSGVELTDVDLGDLLPLLDVVGGNYTADRLIFFFAMAAAIRRGDPSPDFVEATLRTIAEHIGATGRHPRFRVIILEERSEAGIEVIDEIRRMIRSTGTNDIVISLPDSEITNLSPADAKDAIAGLDRHGRIWLVSEGQIILDVPATVTPLFK